MFWVIFDWWLCPIRRSFFVQSWSLAMVDFIGIIHQFLGLSPLILLFQSKVMDFTIFSQFVETFAHFTFDLVLKKLLVKRNVFPHFLLQHRFSLVTDGLFQHKLQIKQVFKAPQKVCFSAPYLNHLNVFL